MERRGEVEELCALGVVELLDFKFSRLDLVRRKL